MPLIYAYKPSFIVKKLPSNYVSTLINIAEGAGEYARYEKHRFYRMAKRSTTECAAILDIAQKLGLSETKKLNDARDLLFRIVSMLIRMVKSGT